MASLYKIERSIMECVDTETGEIIDPGKLESLPMEKRKKVRNIVCWIKDLRSDAAAYDEEGKSFFKRKQAALKKAASLEAYLADALHGEKMKDKEFSISYRKSEVIEVADEAVAKLPDEFKVFAPPRANKKALKEAIKNGAVFEGVQVVEKNNIQIK